MITLTNDWHKSAAARAVPGATYDRDQGAWVLPHPTPRSAVVALKLFPHLLHEAPTLVELRDSMLQDAKPVDYAGQLGLRIGAPYVRAAMAARGWSLDEAKATPIGVGIDYQSVDLGFAAACLREHKGFYLGWSRGLGKTLGTAALIDELCCRSTIVIAPNTAKASTWASELEWALPHEVLVLPNDKRQREACLANAQRQARNGAAFILVVHYEALAVIAGKTKTAKGKSTIGDGWRKLGIQWDLVAADEGHRLANPATLQSKAAGKLRKQADMALVMSGSVFQNRWEEMYGPLHFLFPDRYKSKWRDWYDRYLDYVENGYGKICVGVREDRLEALRDELGRFMVVRDKENLAIPTTEYVQLTPGQRQVYNDLGEQLLASLPNGDRIKSSEGIALLTRLRQVATGLDLFDPGNIADSSKLDRTVEIIKEHWDRGDDYVVFCWYKASAHALHQRLHAELGDDGLAFVITGDTPQKQRADSIKKFQNGTGRILIGTIPTMGESINLQRANHVIRVDRSFNPALNQQAVDRVDRQGQARECYLTDIVAEGTVDDLVVMPTLANKDALRALVFGGQA